jgi:two-component system nitrogen regulation response regulator NtrX
MTSPQILVVDDEGNIRELLEEILSEEGYSVTTAADAEHARAARREQNFDLILLDIWMPDTDGITLLKEWADSGSLGPVVMMSGHGTVDTAVEATRLGALDFIEKPVSLTKLLRTVSKALDTRRVRERRRSRMPRALAPVGRSAAMRELREQIQRVAQHDTPVLFAGEVGSGRRLCARYLASMSDRAEGPFEAVVGADLTDEDASAVLEGTQTEAGALERASGGILFIDGINDIAPRAQKLLQQLLERGRSEGLGTRRSDPIFCPCSGL